MQFVKGAWKILVAIKDGLALLLLLLFFSLIFAALNSAPNPAQVRDGTLLLDLNGFVSEQPAAVDPLEILTSGSAPIREYRQRDLTRSLKLAITDDRIKAVVLDLDGFLGGGQSSLSAIGEQLAALKKAGKPIYAYATSYTDDGYQLAAHANEIWLNPLGGVMLTGPGGSQPYIAGFIEKYGITANIYRVGTYKSAIEPFTRSDQSPEAKEALTAVLEEMWGNWRTEVEKARPDANIDYMLNTPGDAVEAFKGDIAKLSLDNKLVDKLGDHTEFGKYIAGKYGENTDKDIGGFASTSPDELLADMGEETNGGAIGVVTVAGTIIDGDAGAGSAAGNTISQLIYDALENDELKALVVRVDSPGGSVTASEQIRLALEEVKSRKIPIVISMGNLAASGGYWIATPANKIMADPSTITGSIGIFGIIPSFEKILGDYGVTSDGVKLSPLAGEPDILGGFDPEFDRVAQATIERGYQQFLERVAKARGKTVAQIDAIGQGRIWAGGTARQLGLVDQLGGLDEAIAEAAKLAKLGDGDWHVKYIEIQPDDFSAILQGFGLASAKEYGSLDMFARISIAQNLAIHSLYSDLFAITKTQGAQVQCIECPAISGPSGGSGDAISNSQLKLWMAALK